MGKKKTIDTTWSPSFAYTIGIIATDGNLSPDGRHINITSKDSQLLETIKSIMNLKNKIGRKGSGSSVGKKYFCLQFGNIDFYRFLLQIGLTPAKSKTLGALSIPDAYFFDFFRGCIDGDGSISITFHPESKHPQLKIRLVSASEAFVLWIKETITRQLEMMGGWIYKSPQKMYTLSYGKADSIRLINSMYGYNVPCLERKRILAEQFMIGRVA